MEDDVFFGGWWLCLEGGWGGVGGGVMTFVVVGKQR